MKHITQASFKKQTKNSAEISNLTNQNKLRIQIERDLESDLDFQNRSVS